MNINGKNSLSVYRPSGRVPTSQRPNKKKYQELPRPIFDNTSSNPDHRRGISVDLRTLEAHLTNKSSLPGCGE